MVEWYRGWWEGDPFRWIAPSDSVKGWFESFESLNQNRLSLGIWDRHDRRIEFFPSFSEAFDVGNRVIILDNPSLYSRCYAFPPGSIMVLRNWQFQPELYPLSADPEVVVVPLNNVDRKYTVDGRHYCMLFDGEESDELVQINVEGQGCFLDYANVIEKVSRFLQQSIDFGLHCKEFPKANGDYGWYVVVDLLNRNNSLNPVAVDGVERLYRSIKKVKTSLVRRDIIDSDPFWWWLWGEYYYETVSSLSKRSAWVLDLDIRYYNLAIGSSFSSGELIKAVSDHVFIRKYPYLEFQRELLRDSVVYYSQVLVNSQREIRKAAQAAGVPFGNVDDNRNLFVPGTSFLCCGNRKDNGFF